MRFFGSLFRRPVVVSTPLAPMPVVRTAPRGRKHMVAGTAAATLACTFVGGHEGERLKAYRDIAGVPTICNGETRGVTMGMTATHLEC